MPFDSTVFLPYLRPDAAVVAAPEEPLSIAFSSHTEVLVTSPPSGLAQWLEGLDGTAGWQEQVSAAPMPDHQAAALLLELRGAGVLLDADRGRVFQEGRHVERDALGLAADVRGVRPPEPQGPPARIGVVGADSMATTIAAAVQRCPGLSGADPAACDFVVLVTAPFDQRSGGLADTALARGIPSVCLLFSAVDAALSPAAVPGRTACWRCWMLDVGNHRAAARDYLGGGTWSSRGRRLSAPQLPAHHRALVAAVTVEHVLRCLESLAGRASISAARTERRIDLRELAITERMIPVNPVCGCAAAAA